MSETDVMHRVMLALSKAGARVFRNNVAQGVVGQVIWARERQNVTVNRGDAIVRNARVLHAGLAPDSADLIGWVSVEIKPEMVGQKVAVFLSPEVKVIGGKIRPGQVNWRDQVRGAGGIADFVHGPDEALAMLPGAGR